MPYNYFLLIYMILSGATSLGQGWLGSDGNKRVLRIPQSSSITGASPSDCLVLYPGHSLTKSFTSVERQSLYSAAQADWANKNWLKWITSVGRQRYQRSDQLNNKLSLTCDWVELNKQLGTINLLLSLLMAVNWIQQVWLREDSVFKNIKLYTMYFPW